MIDPPHPPEDKACPPAWYQLVARALGFLPQPSLTKAPWLFKRSKGLIAGRQAKTFAPNSTPFSKIQTCIGQECQGNPSTLHLPPQSPPHDWFEATAAKLEGLPKHSAPIEVWIFENGVNVNTTTLTLFPENTQDFPFNQPVCQHKAYSPTLLVCDWLAFSR